MYYDIFFNEISEEVSLKARECGANLVEFNDLQSF